MSTRSLIFGIQLPYLRDSTSFILDFPTFCTTPREKINRVGFKDGRRYNMLCVISKFLLLLAYNRISFGVGNVLYTQPAWRPIQYQVAVDHRGWAR